MGKVNKYACITLNGKQDIFISGYKPDQPEEGLHSQPSTSVRGCKYKKGKICTPNTVLMLINRSDNK